ncbi:MAG: EAL domain-containing protein [Rhodobiaceae bacterium]|nr:EAL domain-containing protein [Rhodobiaceae bacterium]MCC0054885.1 EAL domain-containing protein [Rhodobiaceae bacterium]
MNRIINWVIALSMMAVAASLSAVLYIKVGLPVGEAGWIGVAVLLLMILGQFVAGRMRERSGFHERLEDLSNVTSRLVRDVAELDARIGANEARLLNNIEDTVAEKIAPLSAEIGLLETLVRQIGERIAEAPVREAAARKPKAQKAQPEPVAEEPAKPARPAAPRRTGAFASLSDDAFAKLVADSVNESRMEIHLQPVVTLPQRKVGHYEALTRLKTEDGKLITPEDFLDVAEAGRLMPVIDNMMLYRAVQVVRRLQTREREFGLFCNISPQSLTDGDFFAQFVEFMEHNRALSSQIVFEFSQAAVEAAGPIELASLDRLSELGYRYSMDHVTRLDFDAKALFEQHFRFIKVPAALLLSEAARIDADIDPADLHDLLARYGIELIATDIERESEVVDLLDYDVTLAQGNLFSPPRPVRADVMQDAALPSSMAKVG